MTTYEHLSPQTANTWLELAIENIRREYPHSAWIVADTADDYAMHRDLHPTFFGSFDWHSCVEMYWVAARIMRLFPRLPAEPAAMAVIGELLTPEHIARETAFCAQNPGFERPYGWGWLHKLQHELDIWDHKQARTWSEALLPLSREMEQQYLSWLPKLTYA